jgi:TolB-like protein/Tfp pilus assembly protein PilF
MVVSWLVVQVSDILLPIFDAPDWIMRGLVLLLALGFPISLVLAWFYNVTAEGLRFDQDVVTGGEHAAFPGQRLNYIIIAVLAAAVVLFALDKFLWQTELPFEEATGQYSIAVLPFRNLSGDEANEPFTHGIHDDLLTQLSGISALKTISRTSVMGYKNRDVPIPRIAEELDVDVVLEGGVQRSGDRIRVNAQLIDGKTDAHLWAETYDHLLTAENIFSIQSEISRSIAQTLNATLSADEEKALELKPTDSLEAWEAYASGRSKMSSTSDQDLAYALEQFTSAIRLDPEFAAAWAGLCRIHLSEYSIGRNRASFDAAEAACEKALELDDSRVEVYVALGTLYRYFGQYSKAEVALQRANYAKAEEALNQALVLDTVELDALLELGTVFARQGRLEEAEKELLQAEMQDPRSWYAQTALFSFYYTFSDRPDRFARAASHASKSASLRPDLAASWNNLGAANYMMGNFELAADAWEESLRIAPNRTGFTNSGLALYFSGQFEDAAVMQEKAIEQAPSDDRAMGRLGDALRFIDGREAEALEAYRKASELAEKQLVVNDRDWEVLGQLAVYQAHLGDEEQAGELIARALQWSDQNGETLYQLALIDVAFGRKEEALNALTEAVSKSPGYVNLVKTDPDFQPLRDMPQYPELVTSGQLE